MKAVGVSLFLAATLVINAAESSQPEESGRVLRLGEILVYGTRDSRNLLETTTLESESLDIATSVVDSEAIRVRNASSLADALDLSLGVFTERRGRKEKSLTSFRGQIYPYPDFALNGVWQRAFWEVPAFYPAIAVDRIEILRSGGALMAGPNAGLVGTINLVPRRFDEPTTILDVQGGRFKTFRSSIVSGDRFEKGDYTIGGSFYRTSGPKGENAAERFSTLFGTTSWSPSESLHFELTAFGLHGNRELRLAQDPAMKQLQSRREEYSPYNSFGGVLRALAKHSDNASTSLDLGFVRRSANFHRYFPDGSKEKNVEKDWEYNAGIMHAHKLAEDNTLRVGFQYNHWVCPNGKRFFVGDRMDVHTFSTVITDEQQWDRLTLDGGLRYTRSWYKDFTERKFNITGDNLSANRIWHEWSDPTLTGTMGARYLVTEPVSFYAHAAAGTLDAPTGAVSDEDVELDRETRVILDGGVMLESKELGSYKAGVFTTFRRDALLLTTTKVTVDGDLFNTYDNTNARQYGLEFEGRSPVLLDTFTLFANVTAMNSSRREDGNRVRYREIPHFIGMYGVSAVYGRFDANLYCKHVSGFKNRRFAEGGEYHKLGEFADLSLTAGVSLGSERLTRLYVALENLLDDDYSTVVGYPDYGFQAFVGLQSQF